MPRPIRRIGTHTFSLLTLASLAFGTSQLWARPAAPAAARTCPDDCNAYCKELYGPESTGRCTWGGCLCVMPAT